ncbi:MAG: UDP-N-acetyl-D-mannosamine dehydrogenase [Rickettsiales bacterium]|nr:UDP-N-acetyl-D-mannosamine dehydrogenase [Rickettsiales bacterium]
MSEHPFSTICVMGLGYIGLPTATLIASRGLDVIGVDKVPHVVETINQGKIHIVEPDLEGLVTKVINDGKLKAYANAKPADIFIITVPTPIKEDKSPDMSYVDSALGEIAEQLQPGNLVIIESTSPVGTTQDAAELLAAKRSDLTFPHTHGEESDIRIAYCPERVLPGQIITELMNNDRIIGGMTAKCAELAKRFYHVFVRGDCHIGSHDTAELVKLSENAYRDVNIAFANELSNVCQHHDIDVHQVVQFANLHPRVNILNPGPGVGGHCIPIDPWFIVDRAPDVTPLIQTARRINDERPHQTARIVLDHLKEHPNAKIACLGLAYKPNVDDLRESPAIEIVHDLVKEYSKTLYVSEPHIQSLPDSLTKYPNVKLTDALSAVNEADIIVTLVSHRSFDYISKDAMKDKILLDFSGVWKK